MAVQAERQEEAHRLSGSGSTSAGVSAQTTAAQEAAARAAAAEEERRQALREEFLRLMRERFLDGKDRRAQPAPALSTHLHSAQ